MAMDKKKTSVFISLIFRRTEFGLRRVCLLGFLREFRAMAKKQNADAAKRILIKWGLRGFRGRLFLKRSAAEFIMQTAYHAELY